MIVDILFIFQQMCCGSMMLRTALGVGFRIIAIADDHVILCLGHDTFESNRGAINNYI